MLTLRRLVPLAAVLALAASLAMLPAGASAGAGAGVSKKGKGHRCKKGYKPVTVIKHGKKVRRCKPKGKVTQPAPPCRSASASCATPPLFDPPGKKLVGNEARPFLEKYLLNSTFTDCPAKWPNCSVESRYSHTSAGFYYCRLTNVSGADIINGARAYEVQNVVVEPDGSWTFNEGVENSGGPAFYEWHVATNGAVNGAYQFNSGPIEQIGGLQYVHAPRDCSY